MFAVCVFRYELQGADGNVLVVYPMEADNQLELAGEYICEVYNGYQREQRSAMLYTPVAPPTTTKG